MSSWRDNLANEIPVELPGELLETVEEAWESLSEQYGCVQLPEAKLASLRERLERFDSCADWLKNYLLDAWRVQGEGPPFTLCLITRPYILPEGRAMTPRFRYECRMVGLFELPDDVGKALIRPESIGDKLLELFKRREVDFPECPDFCGTYYVLASDEARLREGLPGALLDHLASRQDLFIELLERELLLYWPSVIGAESVLEACDFFTDLAGTIVPLSSGPYR